MNLFRKALRESDTDGDTVKRWQRPQLPQALHRWNYGNRRSRLDFPSSYQVQQSKVRMPEASCIVKIVDDAGVEHSVQVRAESVYEAAILGMSRLKRHGWQNAGCTMGWVTVEIYEVPTIHRIQFEKMLGWINSSGRTPRDEIRKQKLRTLLKMNEK